jgi:hypothetical protein
VDEAHEGLRRAIAAMGVRKRPAVPLLARSHPINKLLGKMAHQEKERKAAPAHAAKRAPGRRRAASGRT